MFANAVGLALLIFLGTADCDLRLVPAQEEGQMRGAAIEFERSGGFAGISTRYWIFADGRILDQQGKESRISPKSVESVLKRIRALTLPVERKPSLCNDCFRYKVTVSDAAGTRSFAVDEDFLNGEAADSKIVRDLLSFLPK